MHELFKQVLTERDLSRAGDLFSIPDSEIVDDLNEVIGEIRVIICGESYLHNDKEQSVAEICVTRVCMCVREAGCVEAAAPALVQLLDACLRHPLAPAAPAPAALAAPGAAPLAPATAPAPDPPHAKIASDIISCIFLSSEGSAGGGVGGAGGGGASARGVLEGGVGAAARLAGSGAARGELGRHTARYLALAARRQPALLAREAPALARALLAGNAAVARVLAPLADWPGVLPALAAAHAAPALVQLACATGSSAGSGATQQERAAAAQLVAALAAGAGADGARQLAPHLPALAAATCAPAAPPQHPHCLCHHLLNAIVSTCEGCAGAGATGAAAAGAVAAGAAVRALAAGAHVAAAPALASLAALAAAHLALHAHDTTHHAHHALSLLVQALGRCEGALRGRLQQAAAQLCSQHPKLFSEALLHALAHPAAGTAAPAPAPAPAAAATADVNQTAAGVTIVRLGGGTGGGGAGGGARTRSHHHHAHRSMTRLNYNNYNGAQGSVGGLHKSMTRLSSSQQINLPLQPAPAPAAPASHPAPAPAHTSTVHVNGVGHGMGQGVGHGVGQGVGHGVGQGARGSAGAVTVTTISRKPAHAAHPAHPAHPSHHHHIYIPNATSSSNMAAPAAAPAPAPAPAASCLNINSNIASAGHNNNAVNGGSGMVQCVAVRAAGKSTESMLQPLSSHAALRSGADIAGGAGGAGGAVCVRGGAGAGAGAERMSVFEPYGLRDAVQHFCEKHLDKIRAYMLAVAAALPPPAKCTIEERRGKKVARLQFACGEQGAHCLWGGGGGGDGGWGAQFALRTRHPRLWVHLMFLALQARSEHALSSRDPALASLKHCWDTLTSKPFVAIVTSAFPTQRDLDALADELRAHGYFDVFECAPAAGGPPGAPPGGRWGCFVCLHPERALPLLSGDGAHPVIEGTLKEKKGRWRLFRRWRTRYFTLSGAHLSCRPPSGGGGGAGGGGESIDIAEIRSVKVSRGARHIPKAFEIFTGQQTLILKPADGRPAAEWAQCLTVVLAHSAHAHAHAHPARAHSTHSAHTHAHDHLDRAHKSHSLPARSLTLRNL